ncbi:hypothetical protein [Psychroflexus sp. MBR-150]|jgi:hypothetical protein
MKRTILLIYFLTLSLFLHAQEKLNYELNGKNIEFSISQTEIYVEFTPTQKIAIQQYAEQGFTEIAQNSAIVKMSEAKVSFQEQKQIT